MDRQLSDQQVERLAAKLLKDFALNDAAIDEIAAAPHVWRNVKKQIAAEKARREKSWFAAFRAPAFAFAVAGLIVCCGLTIWFLRSRTTQNIAGAPQNYSPQQSAEDVQNVPPELTETKPTPLREAEKTVARRASSRVLTKANAPTIKRNAADQPRENRTRQIMKSPAKEIAPSAVAETKTDFIALTYAANADSGQLVRVKVPSSMMVSLGLKTDVEKESEFVNAEVVVGSDGTARAIRFIR